MITQEQKTQIIQHIRKLGTKTICMPKARFDHWIESLLSGKYIQGKHKLASNAPGCLLDKEITLETTAFCCLGVEQFCNSGYVESRDNLPSKRYMDENLILYFDASFSLNSSPCIVFPDEKSEYIVDQGFASLINDKGASFEEIAEMLKSKFISLEEVLEELSIPYPTVTPIKMVNCKGCYSPTLVGLPCVNCKVDN